MPAVSLVAEPKVRGLTVRRAAAILVALQLIAFGLYPAPVILSHDPATANNPAVRQFFDELLFWVIGVVIIIAPVVAFAHAFGPVFDQTWADARDRLRAVRDRQFVAVAAITATVITPAATQKDRFMSPPSFSWTLIRGRIPWQNCDNSPRRPRHKRVMTPPSARHQAYRQIRQ